MTTPQITGRQIKTPLELDGNVLITGDVDIDGVLAADGFIGFGDTPVTLPSGLHSPYTGTVIVDQGGKGDFTTIKDACDYVATQTRSLNTPWYIFVNTGRYREQPFTVPTATQLVGTYSAPYVAATDFGSRIEFNYVAPTTTSGTMITLDSNASLRGL